MKSNNSIRNSKIEFLRILCIFFVIALHQVTAHMTDKQIPMLNYLYPFLNVSIYVFMLITGYLKATSNNYNFFNIIFIVAICWVLNLIITPFILWDIKGKLDYLTVILGGRDWWYIWAF
ncbi:hypothetical protein [Spiroplasma clarkii]|nr:hypothetical protein [Spiroplasma clarkii]